MAVKILFLVTTLFAPFAFGKATTEFEATKFSGGWDIGSGIELAIWSKHERPGTLWLGVAYSSEFSCVTEIHIGWDEKREVMWFETFPYRFKAQRRSCKPHKGSTFDHFTKTSGTLTIESDDVFLGKTNENNPEDKRTYKFKRTAISETFRNQFKSLVLNNRKKYGRNIGANTPSRSEQRMFTDLDFRPPIESTVKTVALTPVPLPENIEGYYIVSPSGVLSVYFSRIHKDWGYRARPTKPADIQEGKNYFLAITESDPAVKVDYSYLREHTTITLEIPGLHRDCRYVPGFEVLLKYEADAEFEHSNNSWKFNAKYLEKACITARRVGCGGYICEEWANKFDPVSSDSWYITNSISTPNKLVK